MTDVIVERRRTGWDVVLRTLLLVAGLVVLGHTVLATVVSVLFIGWFTLASGIAALTAALFRIRPRFAATLTLLGTLLGIELLIDGVTILLEGRLRVHAVPRRPTGRDG